MPFWVTSTHLRLLVVVEMYRGTAEEGETLSLLFNFLCVLSLKIYNEGDV